MQPALYEMTQVVRKHFLELCGCSCFRTILEVFLFNRKKIKETCISVGRSLSNDFLYTSGKTIGFLMVFFCHCGFLEIIESLIWIYRKKFYVFIGGKDTNCLTLH